MNLPQSHSPYPCAAGREEVEKSRNEDEPRKKSRGRVFEDWVLFLIMLL